MSLEPQNLSQKKRFQLLDIGDKQNEIHMTVSLKWMERLCTPDCSESNKMSRSQMDKNWCSDLIFFSERQLKMWESSIKENGMF